MTYLKSFIHNKFRTIVDLYLQKLTNCTIIAAISGGQDSMCLLKLLKDFQHTYHWNIIVVNFNHEWRQDSNANSNAIKNIAIRWGFKFAYFRKFVHTENYARIWRYNKLIELAKRQQINYILTAHTLTDRIETTLHNLIRGSGSEGISALNFTTILVKEIKIIRPLLCLNRNETLWFCKKFYSPIWSDITNYSYLINRNRIRQELIPYIKKYFNDSFDTNFHYFIDITTKEVKYLQEQSSYFYNICKHPKYVGINQLIINKLPIPIQRRIIRIFFYKNLNLKLNFIQTEKIRQKYIFCRNKTSSYKINNKYYLINHLNWIYLINKQTNYIIKI
uniref:tRNA(Ile)-lysidine synthase n=1 Tax=Pulvinaster venetus TaxID=427767 RepID=UPI001FCE0022|nr:tRNA(Ile)-lysidine synthase [Pulvinaster venetus]UNJ17045.1 tRNA(Ile)-lysidine synthase [Pulvinaster venetus]